MVAFDSKEFLKTLTHRPGVYRMLDAEEKILYVGKARDLKKRVSSYFRATGLAPKTEALMRLVARVEVTVTHTENEALILENNLIKEHLPRFNILLRDDKSYPYILLTAEAWPRLAYHRGAKRRKGRYFGPYPSVGAVRESLRLMQKVFRLRQCEDSVFNNRTRPCLQYQIERCKAPCVNLVSADEYRDDVRHTELFLEGRSTALVEELVAEMTQASEQQQYEQAAQLRDQVQALRRVQERQYISGERGDLDVVVAVTDAGVACVQVFLFRGGQSLGNRAFFPQHVEQTTEAEILAAFLSQYYVARGDHNGIPAEVLVNVVPDDVALLEIALTEQAGRQVKIRDQVRGDRARWRDMALENARLALQQRLATRGGVIARLEALQDLLGMEVPPERIECFDISHTRGEAPVASCVVFAQGESLRADYRRFNLRDTKPGDDYGAMREALTRRYQKIVAGEGKLPDLLLIDGGPGQLKQAVDVLDELGVQMGVSGVTLIGVAKGEGRKAGLETLHRVDAPPLENLGHTAALNLILQVRDEAHRFAITGHRGRREKARRESALEEIAGIGAKRRQQLYQQFGGLQEIRRAGVEDLARVPGISRALAQRIYDHFHAG
jgi:excinuclease ABC subunit C